MWNAQVAGLLNGVTCVIYDGNPGGSKDKPDWGILWRMAAEEKVTFFGAGAAFFANCQKAGVDIARCGDLSRVRANLVKQDTLHKLAMELGLAGMVRLGEGEMRSGGQHRPSILADALEAVIGAVYLDAGFEKAQALVQRLFEKLDVSPTMTAAAKDPKTELQEWLQARKMPLPDYKVVNTLGAAHQQTFDVACEIAQLSLVERGIGGSRRAAEQAAASAMLQTIHSKAPHAN
jgi:ribonuclease-3